MKIGEYQIYVVETSRFALDGGAMFGIIPKTLWEKQIPADGKNRIPMCTRSLFLVSADRRIIVDTGNGDKWDDKYRAIYKVDTETVNIEKSLKRIGFTPGDVTDVICTHLHFDHAGGNTRFDENDKIVPTFPNATYWIQQANWELANSPSEKDEASYLSENWEIIAENGMFEFLNGEEEVVAGLDLIVTNGHTTGQQHPKISDGNSTIFYGGDLFPTSAHIPVPWVMAYDILPATTIEEKKQLLPQMVTEGWILFLEHDISYEAVTVDFDGKNYRRKESLQLKIYPGG